MTTCMMNLQNGPASDVRSLNSNNYMSTQRSKVSIGILVEKSLKIVPGAYAISETMSKLPVKDTVQSFHGKSIYENQELEATSKRESKIPEMRNKLSGKSVHKEPGDHSISAAEVVQFFPTNGFTSQMRADVNKKLDCLTDAENNEHLIMEDKSTLTSKNEIYKVTKDAVKAEKSSHEDLRMKLLDILGSGPSGNKQIPSPRLSNGSAELPEQDVLREEQNGKTEKSIPSDPIESNSESQNNAACGPFTCSAAQKNVAKNQSVSFQVKSSVAVRKLSPLRSERKTKLGKSHVFSFDGVAGVGCSKMHETEVSKKIKQNTDGNTSKVRPWRISFSKKPVSFERVQASEKKQVSSPPRNTSIGTEACTPGFNLPEKSVERGYASAKSFTNLKEQPCMLSSMREHPASGSDRVRDTASPRNKKEYLCPSDAIPKINSGLHSDCEISLKSSSLKRNIGANMNCDKPYLHDDHNKLNIYRGPELSRHSNDHENVINYSQSSGKRQPFDELPSPTLAGNVSPTISTEKSTERSDSPILDQKMSSPEASEQKTNSRNSRPQSSELDGESKDSEGSFDSLMKRTSTPVNGKPWPQKGVQETEELEVNDGSSKDCARREKWFSDVDCKEKSPFTLRNRKRPRLSEETNANNLDTPATPFLDTLNAEEDGRCHEAPEQFQEDCLPTAVSQLMRVVEKLQTKLKSKEKKKNSEILLSVADRLHSQMLDIEAQIQADVKKFTGLAKSKRKHLEATFEAQEEKLKSIHEKFKAELNQHLQDCRGTFEELEAFQEELKGNIDTQKASHRKLLLQVEEEMKVQLSDAETNITAVQKVARKKMNGLKHVLSEWLNEVALS